MRSQGDPRKHFAATVARLQRDRGFSDKELAARAKLGTSDLRAIQDAEGQIGVDVIFLLAGALGVEPGQLLKGIAWDPDASGGAGGYRFDPEGD
jgi:transcriptional regulator with XRE-family HTH domain